MDAAHALTFPSRWAIPDVGSAQRLFANIGASSNGMQSAAGGPGRSLVGDRWLAVSGPMACSGRREKGVRAEGFSQMEGFYPCANELGAVPAARCVPDTHPQQLALLDDGGSLGTQTAEGASVGATTEGTHY